MVGAYFPISSYCFNLLRMSRTLHGTTKPNFQLPRRFFRQFVGMRHSLPTPQEEMPCPALSVYCKEATFSTKHHFSHMLPVKIAMQSFVLATFSLWHSVFLFHDSEINLKVDDVEHIRFCTINRLETLHAALGGESDRSHHIYMFTTWKMYFYISTETSLSISLNEILDDQSMVGILIIPVMSFGRIIGRKLCTKCRN